MKWKIRFFKEEVEFNFKNRVKTRQWITEAIREEAKIPGLINIVFCSDTYLFELNKAYLDHTTLTDIISFPFPDKVDKISGDIYISVDRVRENAVKFNQSFDHELNRVIIHGILHLLGYKDKKEKDKLMMTSKENHYLGKWNA